MNSIGMGVGELKGEYWSCRVTYLDPCLFLGIVGVIFGLASVDCLPLAGRGNFIGATDGGRSLPVLHLGHAGWTRRGGRVGGRNRHQK
jgi:hypothetical protein